MIEVLALSLALCQPPDLPAPEDVRMATEGVIPVHLTVDEVQWIFGGPQMRPTIGSPEGSELTYRVGTNWVYRNHRDCLWQWVHNVLSDERSWPSIREALPGETPNIYIRLASPATCESWRHSCAFGSGGRGVIELNAYTWFAARDVNRWRRFIINHEVGHILGMDHESCSEAGPSVMNPWSEACGASEWPSAPQRQLSEMMRRG